MKYVLQNNEPFILERTSGTEIVDLTQVSSAGVSKDYVDTALEGKQDTIDDLADIRSGAELGATALQSFIETDPVFTASAAAGIQSTDITNWNSKTSNTGTITGITMNGVSKGTSGVVNLGTVITSETSLSKGTTSGAGNAVTDISVSGHEITLTKGKTFLESETDPVFSASAAAGIQSTDITNWNGKTSNTGTITGITMNGVSKGTSGVVDLGTVITSHQSLDSYADGAEYDSTNHLIYLKHGSTRLSNPINANDFIKDGMVDTVTIDQPSTGTNAGVDCLIITFNTDAGKSPIEIPLSDIFDPSNYYTKNDIDTAGYLTSETQLSKGTTTGAGNAVTDISVSNHQITLTKGKTFLESGTTLDSIADGTTRKLADYLPLSGGTMTGQITFPTASSATDNTKGINFGSTSSVVAHVGTSTLLGLYSGGKIVLRPNGATSGTAGNGSLELANDGIVAREVITAEGFAKSGGTSSQFLKADGSVDSSTYLTSFTETDPVFSASAAAGIQSTDITNWNSKTSNTGTITGINMNGASKGTSGVVDLGTVITSETSLSKGTTTGAGNAVTDISVSGHEITLTKGKTFLESETDPVFSASAAAGIQSTDITNWNGKTSNVGTVTGVKMNSGSAISPNSSGVVDLGTVITSETSLSKGTTSGGGNAVTDISVSGHQITLTKGKTFLESETDPVFSASAAAGIQSSDITNWNSKTSNTGTITGITMNGSSKGTSGVVNLGTVITSETQLSKGTTTGSGNAVTDISVSNHQITLTKGKTFLESETDPVYSASAAAGITSSDITNWNSKTDNVGTITGITMNGSSKGTSGVVNLGTVLTEHQSIKTINNTSIVGTGNVTINALPTVSSTDNGKILQVVNGVWTLVSPVALYSGSGSPNNSLGNDGDLYIQT